MRIEHLLFLVLRVIPKYRAKVEDVLKLPGSLLLTVLRRCYWCDSYFILFGVCVSCRILYYIVSFCM